MQSDHTKRYGVIRQTVSDSDIDQVAESIRRLGYGIVDGGYDDTALADMSAAFERARERYCREHGGAAALEAIDEHNTIRLPLAYEPAFLELAANRTILELCARLIAGYVVLNQQNGVINPPHAQRYNQGAWHRDLPYQHFVSSRPLAINALFCLDAFTIENGATRVLPASHQQEDFPSDRFIESEAATVGAPAGSFIVLDCMAYHSGGVNRTERPRRAVNQVYSIPLIKQQVDLPAALGEQFTADPQLRKLLGYDVRTPHSVGDYLASRAGKAGK
jgi:ectoine hydroxylase-related dioxygenase (phytanoyl-CoA dioxygenase family)